MNNQNVSKENIKMNLARLKREGATFEVVINPEEALKFKRGEGILADALRDLHVYSDAKKGQLAPENEVASKLGCSGEDACAKILKDGDLQLTGEIRDGFRAQKRAQVVQEVHKYGVDPRTNAPHPISRIETAMDEAKVRLDERSAQEQLKDVIKQLNHILPLKVSVKRMEVYLPAEYANKCYGKLKAFGTIKKDAWQSDGSWRGELEMPGGLEADFYDLISNMTSGHAEVKVISQ